MFSDFQFEVLTSRSQSISESPGQTAAGTGGKMGGSHERVVHIEEDLDDRRDVTVGSFSFGQDGLLVRPTSGIPRQNYTIALENHPSESE